MKHSLIEWLTSTPRLLAILLIFVMGSHPAHASSDLPIHDGVGGDFVLQSSLGGETRLSDYRGKVVLLFFGYTSCQDICPATLSHLRALTLKLGSDADRAQVLLVTVDPETDTPERLKEYMGRFDERFVGLSGTTEETGRAAALFMVESTRSHGVEVTMQHNRSKSFVDSGYLYAHSQQIYLLDKVGRTRALYYTGTPLSEMEQAVRDLFEE
jgi:protein SCO1/2